VSVSGDELRRMALALPEASEEDHHGKPSFRVGGKIFATLWDASTVNLMLDADGIRTAVHALPGACSERWWGKRLSAVAVDLGRIAPAELEELLAEAWEHKAPARLCRETP
jgi:hypothetical protein